MSFLYLGSTFETTNPINGNFPHPRIRLLHSLLREVSRVLPRSPDPAVSAVSQT